MLVVGGDSGTLVDAISRAAAEMAVSGHINPIKTMASCRRRDLADPAMLWESDVDGHVRDASGRQGGLIEVTRSTRRCDHPAQTRFT